MYATRVECRYTGGDSLTADGRAEEFGAGQWEVKGMRSLLLTEIAECILYVHYSLKRKKIIRATLLSSRFRLEQGRRLRVNAMASGTLTFQRRLYSRGECKVLRPVKICAVALHPRVKLGPVSLSSFRASVMSSRVQKCRFENDKYFHQTGFLLVIEVGHSHMDIRTHIPARCEHVLQEARSSICHLQHLLERSCGEMGPLLTKIASLNTDTAQQTGHRETETCGGELKKKKSSKTKLPHLPLLSAQYAWM